MLICAILTTDIITYLAKKSYLSDLSFLQEKKELLSKYV